MNEETIEKIINDYQEQLNKQGSKIELSKFEKILLKVGIKCGYEYKKHELELKEIYEGEL